MFERLFIAHPRSVGETYWQHAETAGYFGVSMLTGGIACLIHAIFPTLFMRTASDTIKRLYGEMKSRQPAFADQPPSFATSDWRLEYEI
jgi:hypothetical protein